MAMGLRRQRPAETDAAEAHGARRSRYEENRLSEGSTARQSSLSENLGGGNNGQGMDQRRRGLVVELRPVLACADPGIGGVVGEVVACPEDGGEAATGALSCCWMVATRGKENMERVLVRLGAAPSLQGELG